MIRFSRKNRFFFLKQRVNKNEIIVLSFDMSEFRKIFRACWSVEKALWQWLSQCFKFGDFCDCFAKKENSSNYLCVRLIY